MKQTCRKLLLASCVGTLFASGPTAVQQAAAAAEAKPEQLESVIVTAQKRRERLQEIPVSMTALGEEGLDSLNITSVSTLQVAVPNVIIGNPLGQGIIRAYIRGVGTANPVFSQDPAVAIYVDDVYLARALGANIDFFDMERVEVLRGPQGTLYGANSPAGAIRIVTAKPSLTEGLGLKGQAILGNYKERGLNLAANVPIVDGRVAARLVAQSGSHDGYQTNLTDGTQSATRDFTNLLLHLLGKLSDRWDLLLTATDFDNRANPTTGVNFAGPGGTDLFDTPGFSRRDYFSAMKTRYDNVQSRGVTADLTGRLGAYDFRSITAYRSLKFQINQDGDGKELSIFENSQFLDNAQYTQEFNLSGQQGPLKWLAGAYLINEQTNFSWHVRIRGSAINPPLGVAPSFQTYDQTKESWSVFTQETWAATDRLTLTGGLRWTDETKDFRALGFVPTQVVDIGLPPGAPIPGFDIRQKKSWGALQWRLAADYKISKDALAFASASRGYRGGGFNGGARTIAEAQAPAFNPEYQTTYEIGAKTEWLARRLRLNVTYFRSDYTDQQVAFLVTGGVFGTLTIDSKISGWELESMWLPTAGLRLFANAGTLRGSTNSATTNFVPNPKYQYSVGFDYSGPAAAGRSWFIGSNYFRTAAHDLAINLDPRRRVPAYGNLAGRVGMEADGGKWRIELVGSNLLNDYWPTFSFNIPPLTSIRIPNTPRLVSLKLTLVH